MLMVTEEAKVAQLVMTFSITVCKSTDPLCLCDLPLGPLNRENTETCGCALTRFFVKSK